uniref:Uncharacterized protein n=1 Tax=Romanomermis culicivorax TaxID=13658 RepID=A0A915I0X4_ROMCU
MAFDAVSQSEEYSSKSHLPSQIISQQIPRMENDDSSAVPEVTTQTDCAKRPLQTSRVETFTCFPIEL